MNDFDKEALLDALKGTINYVKLAGIDGSAQPLTTPAAELITWASAADNGQLEATATVSFDIDYQGLINQVLYQNSAGTYTYISRGVSQAVNVDDVYRISNIVLKIS